MPTVPVIWLLLVALTVSSFGLSGAAGRAGLAPTVLVLGVLKAGLVAWYFMGVRSAHPLWRFALAVLVSVPMTLVALLA